MKLWLSGLALLIASSSVWAENYRIVQSPSQKLDVWIDNIKNNTPQSWCATELPLRIVANGDKKPSVLKAFMPRLGTLLASQCPTLNVIRWQLTDAQGAALAHGTAGKSGGWEPETAPSAPAGPTAVIPRQESPEELSPPADRTPWLGFELQGGCRLRTYWQDEGGAPAWFIPAGNEMQCDKDGWLNGRREVAQHAAGGERKIALVFVHGFPLAGLNADTDADSLLITHANNERMVIGDDRAAHSWMILPYAPKLNGWQADGTIAVEAPRAQSNNDDALLRARLEQVRKVWSSRLAPGVNMTILLVDPLYPQLRDPAVATYRTVK